MRLTLRRKINILVILLLSSVASGIAYLTADYFVGDFTQHLLKSNVDAAALLAGRVQFQMRAIVGEMTVLAGASFEEFRYSEDKLRFIEDTLAREPYFLGLTLYHAKTGQPSGLVPTWRAVRPDPAGRAALTRADFEDLNRGGAISLEAIARGEVEFAVTRLKDGAPVVRIGIPVFRAAGAENAPFSVVMIGELRYDYLASIMEESTQYSASLVDRSGVILATSEAGYFAPGERIAGTAFALSGAQQTIHGKRGEPLTASVSQVGFAGLTVLAHSSLSWIDQARGEVYLRAALLAGALLFLGLAYSALFTRALTGPIQALSEAADRIGQGDFSARVKVPNEKSRTGGDEVTVLARSFNLMAGRIRDLMTETAQKARMEKELETARALQALFLPESEFDHAHLRLSGGIVAASECGGDWWNYCRIGEHLLVVVGDVTGHGAPAALLTAAAQGAFSLFLDELKLGHEQDPERWLHELSRKMNVAILGSGRRQFGLALSASVLDLESGVAWTASFANRIPFVYRKGAKDRYIQLTSGSSLGLGDGAEIKPRITRVELEPGDLIFWYSDGLIECENPEKQPFGRRRLLRAIEAASVAPELDPKGIRQSILAEASGFIGGEAQAPQDDVTLVTGIVPVGIQFKRHRPAA